MNILAIISSYFPSLTKSEQKVAQYVLANPDDIEATSIQELAKKASVGESTIIRFVRKIGYTGYQDFKLALVKSQFYETSTDSPDIVGDENIVHQQYTDSLAETLQFLTEQEKEVEIIAKKINEAESIYLFAAGNSTTIATDFANRLVRIGKKAIFYPDSHIQAINASVMKRNDLAIAISVSGNTEDILLNLEVAKKTGASMVAMTNYLNSGVFNLTDDVLVCSSKEFSSIYGSFTAKIAQLYAIDVLFHKVVNLDKENIQKLRDQTNSALIDRL